MSNSHTTSKPEEHITPDGKVLDLIQTYTKNGRKTNIWLDWSLGVAIQKHFAQQQQEAKEITEFMTASSILTTMSPLMVHRLEADFPSMTKEIIEKTYDDVRSYMKPFMDRQKALSQPNKLKEGNDE